MVKVVHFQGQTIRADAEVKAPKLRYGLACCDKSVCHVDFCSKVDIAVGIPKIHRPLCDRDSKRRLDLSRNVSVKVCVKANCGYLKVQAGNNLLHIPPALNCLKYIEESRGKNKPNRYSRERRIYRRGAVGGWHYRDVR